MTEPHVPVWAVQFFEYIESAFDGEFVRHDLVARARAAIRHDTDWRRVLMATNRVAHQIEFDHDASPRASAAIARINADCCDDLTAAWGALSDAVVAVTRAARKLGVSEDLVSGMAASVHARVLEAFVVALEGEK